MKIWDSSYFYDLDALKTGGDRVVSDLGKLSQLVLPNFLFANFANFYQESLYKVFQLVQVGGNPLETCKSRNYLFGVSVEFLLTTVHNV